MLMPIMAGEAMALATGAMVDTVWDTPDMVDMVWDTLLVPMDTAVLDTAATTLARERLRLSQRPNPRLMLMPGMVHTVWDTLDSMVDMVWDTPDSMVDTVWDTLLVPMDTAATTSARERPRLSQRLMLMPTTDMGLDTEAMVDMVWDTAPGVEREVICYKRS